MGHFAGRRRPAIFCTLPTILLNDRGGLCKVASVDGQISRTDLSCVLNRVTWRGAPGLLDDLVMRPDRVRWCYKRLFSELMLYLSIDVRADR